MPWPYTAIVILKLTLLTCVTIWPGVCIRRGKTGSSGLWQKLMDKL